MVHGQKLLGQHPASNYVFLLTQVVLLLDHVESSQAQSDQNIIEYPKPQGQHVIFLLTTLLRRNLLWENGGNLFLALTNRESFEHPTAQQYTIMASRGNKQMLLYGAFSHVFPISYIISCKNDRFSSILSRNAHGPKSE